MTRFQPTRAGIINMWDYRDEEFCFADGWLILRGPNGSGRPRRLRSCSRSCWTAGSTRSG